MVRDDPCGDAWKEEWRRRLSPQLHAHHLVRVVQRRGELAGHLVGRKRGRRAVQMLEELRHEKLFQARSQELLQLKLKHSRSVARSLTMLV